MNSRRRILDVINAAPLWLLLREMQQTCRPAGLRGLSRSRSP
jgi:hypothetical protein